MSISFELTAELREEAGKGASRRLRRGGKVPGILYGGDKEPRSITLDQMELQRGMEHEAFFSHILTIKVGDVKQECIIKDLQRNPARKEVLHVDLQRIMADQAIRMNVPLHFLNEDSAHGVKQQGGVVSHTITDVEIECLPRDLPEYIEVDMAAVELDQVVHLSELTLPEGVQLVAFMHGAESAHDQAVAAIHLPRVSAVEDEAEAEAAEAAEGEAAAVGEGEGEEKKEESSEG